MTVPFSDAVARRVPVLFSASDESGVLCARMSWVTVSDLVLKRRTSPVGCCELADDAWEAFSTLR